MERRSAANDALRDARLTLSRFSQETSFPLSSPWQRLRGSEPREGSQGGGNRPGKLLEVQEWREDPDR